MEKSLEAPEAESRPTKRRPSATLAATMSGMKLVLKRQDRPARAPLSYAQQRLWFIDRLRGNSCEYNMPFGLRLRGELDYLALERAINTIVERQESLRTHFEEIDGEPYQVIQEDVRITIPLEDLSGLEEQTRNERVMRALKQEGTEPFDLSRAPLLRVKLLKLSPREHVCLETMHHITSDGWSWGVFHRELITIYDAYRQEHKNPLEPLTVQYADFTLCHRKWLESGVLAEGLKYWKEQLHGIPERLDLPADHARHPHSPKAEVFVVTLPPDRLSALKELSRSNQATLYMTLLAAFGVVLSQIGRASCRERV